MRLVVLLLLWSCVLLVRAQSWQQVLDEVVALEEMMADEAAGADNDLSGQLLHDSYELLEQLASHPFDLNSATREELEQLPFLTAQQVMDIQDYLYHYGPMRSLAELRMIRTLDWPQLSLLPFFVYVDPSAVRHPISMPSLDSLLHSARHTLSATVRVPFYQRRGDRNGYLGYPYRHTLRYELSSRNHLRLGLVAAQDAGEPLFAKGNSWGYDYYSYYLQLRNWGRLSQLVVGKYKLSAGMGLVLGQSFQLGKLATLQNLGRTTNVLRPHGSRSEADYFQGAAATVSLLPRPARADRSLQLTAFASRRAMDATLNANGQAQTLITSGYHRTPTEMAKKGNTHISSAGTHVAFRQGALRLGATAVCSELDRSLEPQRQTLYRRHYAHGRHFTNLSADYAYQRFRLALSGETATDAHGALATVNALSYQPSARISLLALQRFYSYRYTSLYGHSFGESSRPQNESGIYLGVTCNPLPHLRLQGYADYAYFPWARYQASLTSEAYDFMVQATYQLRRWTLTARHRSHLRQKDNSEKTAIMASNEHRQRLAVSYNSGHDWTAKTQLDLAFTRYKQRSNGWMVSQHGAWNTQKGGCGLQLSAMAALFNTDSFQSSIYVYERQLQHEFYFPSFYGQGLRLFLQGRLDLPAHWRLAARLGYTNYFNRSHIGSSLQEINHSHQTDAEVQLICRF